MTNPRPNPYVGPKALTLKDQIYGRDREMNQVFYLLTAERIILLHSPSGAGKTSLIQAGLLGKLREDEDYRALPIARVQMPDTLVLLEEDGENGSPRERYNRFVFSVLLSLEEGRPESNQVKITRLKAMSLADYLEIRLGELEETALLVLIIDQFEEILTIDPASKELKEEFFRQLGDALQNRRIYALFAIREDYLGALEPYTRQVPTRLAHRFRLDLLNVEAARQAIQGPAKNAKIVFTEAAVDKLVDDLRGWWVQDAEGKFTIQPGPYIEPVQLQLVCYNLWEKLEAEDTLISIDQLGKVGDVNRSLAEYYASRVQEIAEIRKISERAIRDWFEKHLITPQGVRSMVLKGPQETGGLDNLAVNDLDRARLIRPEKRGGVTWVELTHDRLIDPVRENNDAWRKEHLSLLQRQAPVWADSNRPDGMLLRGEALQEAERWVADHRSEITMVEREFLERSQEAIQKETREREREEERRRLEEEAKLSVLKLQAAQELAEEKERAAALELQAARERAEERERATARLRRRALFLAGALILAIFMMSAAVYFGSQAYISENNAQAAREMAELASTQAKGNQIQAEQERMAAIATGQYAEDQRKEAEKLKITAVFNEAEAEKNAREILLQTAQRHAIELISSKKDKQYSLNLQLLFAITAVQFTEKLGVPPVVQARDALITALSQTGGIPLNNVDNNVIMRTIPGTDWLVTADKDGTIRLWDLSSENPAANPIGLAGSDSAIADMVFSPNGRWLITVDQTDMVRAWDVTSPKRNDGKLTPDLVRKVSSPALIASPDRRWLAISSPNPPQILLWDLESESFPDVPDQLPWKNPQKGESSLLKFSQAGGWLATISGGSSLVWDLKAAVPISQTITDEKFIVEILAFSPDDRWLAAGNKNGDIRLFDLARASQPADPLLPPPYLLQTKRGSLARLEFSPDNRWLMGVNSEKNRSVYLWDLSPLLSGPPGKTSPGVKPYLLEDHTTYLNSHRFSLDSHWLLTVKDSGNARLWDLHAANPTSKPRPLTNFLSSISLSVVSPKGRWLAIYESTGAIHVWDLQSAEPADTRRSLSYYKGSIAQLTFSQDERWLASRSTDGKAYLWDMQSEAKSIPSHSLLGSSNKITMTIFSQDGRWLATSSDDGKARLWDMQLGGKSISSYNLPGQFQQINSLIFSRDGRWLATGGSMGDVRLWKIMDVQAGKFGFDPVPAEIKQESRTGSRFRNIDFNSDWSRLRTLDDGNTISLWDAASLPGDPIQSIRPTGGFSFSRSFSPDWRWLASGSDRGVVVLWDLQAGTPLTRTLAIDGPEQTVSTPFFSKNGKWLGAYSQDFTVHVWNIQSTETITKSIALHGHESRITALQFSPDESWLASGSQDGSLRVWKLPEDSSPPKPIVLDGHNKAISSLEFSQNGRWLVSRSQEDQRLWDLSVDVSTATPEAGWENEKISLLSLSPEGNRLAAVSSITSTEIITTYVHLLDLESLDPLKGPVVENAGNDPVSLVKFSSPDGRWLAIVSYASENDGQITETSAQLLEWKSGSPAVQSRYQASYKEAITLWNFSPQSNLLAGVSNQGVIRVWDLAGEGQVADPLKLESIQQKIYSLAISPDERWLATSGSDETIRLWDLRDENYILLVDQEGGASSIAFSPDGKRLATLAGDGVVRIWGVEKMIKDWEALDIGEMLEEACRAVTRDFNPQEWNNYFPGEPQTPTCPQFPAPENP